MNKFKDILKLLKLLFFSRNLYLVNSPLEYLCLVEWCFKSKTNKKNVKVIVGFSNDQSHKQIKLLSKKYYVFGECLFLRDLFFEFFFKFFLNLYKVFHLKKNLVVVGDFKYYLNVPIYNKAKKIIFMDEGISLTRFNKKNILNKNFKLFTIFNHLKDYDSILNEFAYIKNQILEKKKIDSHKIFLLGTRAAASDLITKEFYYEKIVRFSELYPMHKIIFIPHRADKIFEQFKLPKNISVLKIDVPIEVEFILLDRMPKIIAGFYSSALLNLSIILNGTGVKLINIAYDLKDYQDKSIKSSFKIITNLPQFKSINQIKL